MGIAIETVRNLANDAEQLGREVANALLDVSTEPAGLAAAFLSRAAQSLRSSVLLASAGLEADAMSAMRTSVELLIDLAYILGEDTPARMQRFQTFEDIAQFRFAKGISLLHGGNVDSLAMQELEERSQGARRLYGATRDGGLPQVRDWDGTSLAHRASAIGLDAIYGTTYRDACAASHSGAATLRYVIDVDEKGTHFRWGPSHPSAKPSSLALYNFCGLLKVAIDNFDLAALREKYDALIADWSRSR
jgi:hypothetical protein